MSDAVVLSICAGMFGLATMYLKARIEAKAKLAEAVAKVEAEKLHRQLDAVELKIDGRLTELLETTRLLAQAQGKAEGKIEGRANQKADIKELQDQANSSGLKIDASTIDITAQQVHLGEKKPGDKTVKKPEEPPEK